MNPSRFTRRRWLALGIFALSGLMLCGAVARAQDDEDGAADNEAKRLAEHLMHDSTFNSWAFGYDQTPADAQMQLERSLDLRLDDVHRAVNLTEPERKAIHLAGRADIKRHFEQLESLRRKLLAVGHAGKPINETVKEIQRLRLRLTTGVFDEGSIFRKSLRQTVGAQRAEQYREHERQRRAFQYRAKVEWVVAMLDNVMALNEDQRQAFTRLLIERTKPPKYTSEYDHYLILWQLSGMSEDQVKPLFDETQWKILNRQFSNSRSVTRFLRREGRLQLEGDETSGPEKTDVEATK